ncbi:hypothetical protein GR925_28485 [Streptomyces sp. HUCO-GS316]|uniref:hypothetical protein n=1 Tax=Streptomyces sp. HUCO-GS316 TaxID=2692198 RepID=UPI001372040C|nr:hypothetical protein [Streptomyces sp. HUCO-GS316]MXM67263.1 hypothetical protein [Streptomyces sp. HUCO-GS316]
MVGRTLTCAAASAALLLGSAALAPAAAADDGDDLTAQQLAQQAKDNLLKAKSVHLKLIDHSAGTATSKRQPTAMDLSLDQAGNCVGNLRMGANGGSVEIVKQGDEVWMKPDTAFWKSQVPGAQGGAVAELFKDRYIHGSTQDALLKGMADTCDLSSFQQDIATDTSSDKTLTKGEETTVDDTKVIPLNGTEDGKRAVLYVTSDSPHRVVRATQKGGGTDLALAFSDYDKPVPTQTPPADESVDVGKLQEELQSL